MHFNWLSQTLYSLITKVQTKHEHLNCKKIEFEPIAVTVKHKANIAGYWTVCSDYKHTKVLLHTHTTIHRGAMNQS